MKSAAGISINIQIRMNGFYTPSEYLTTEGTVVPNLNSIYLRDESYSIREEDEFTLSELEPPVSASQASGLESERPASSYSGEVLSLRNEVGIANSKIQAMMQRLEEKDKENDQLRESVLELKEYASQLTENSSLCANSCSSNCTVF